MDELEAQVSAEGQEVSEGTDGADSGKQAWWETAKPEELDAFFESPLANERFENRLKSELDRAVDGVRRGKDDKIHPTVRKKLAEAEQSVRARIQQEQEQRNAQEQQELFRQQWVTMPPDERARVAAQWVDQQLRSEEERRFLDERLQPYVEPEAIRVAGSLITESILSDYSAEELEAVKAAIREDGVDDTTPEGRKEVIRRLIDTAARDKLAQKEADLTAELEKKLDAKFEALKAETLGTRLRNSDSPDLGRSQGSTGSMDDLDTVLATADPATPAWRKAYQEKYRFAPD